MKEIYTNLLVSVVTTLLLFGMLEGLTRLYVWGQTDMSFSIKKDLVQLVDNINISDNTFNIYYLGGSTVEGGFFGEGFTIPNIIDYMHDHEIQGKDIRSINIAKSGEDFYYNLKRLRIITSNKDTFKPSLVVIYSGHNEFLKFHQNYGLQLDSAPLEWLMEHSLLLKKIAARLQLFKLEINERMFSDEPLFGNDQYKAVIDKYQSELEEAVQLLTENGIPVIISTVAGNYTGWQPNRSIYCSNKQDKDFWRLIQRGESAELASDFNNALNYYQQALHLCKNFAETHYRLGKIYEALSEYDKALEAYNKAVDLDGMPLRASSIQNDFIKTLNSDKSVFVVDAVKALQEKSDTGLIGFNLMMDGHHPNRQGYLIISNLIAQKITDIFDTELSELHDIELDRTREIFDMDDNVYFVHYVSIGRWFAKLSTWRYDPGERLNMSEESFLKAMELDDSRYESYLGLATVNFLRKNSVKAEEYLAKAKSIDEQHVGDYLKGHWVQAIIKYADDN
ncbi:MAG: tetratricopeptide repeat protein [Proteobacteria bacterium]|nr:tetratricopeptide repeat protein [Pseudomonadota bacterium]